MALPSELPMKLPLSGMRQARRPRADASERILQAAVRRIVESGSSSITMHEVAEEAGVSKGLIHYHFHDKQTLLTRMVEWMSRGLIARERSALLHSMPRQAIDDLWSWLSGELERGHVRVLLELAEWREELVQRAVREAMRARRVAATISVDRLFGLLGLRPRIPTTLMADMVVAFMDGLAVSAALDQDFNARAGFDVFWLAVLSLGE